VRSFFFWLPRNIEISFVLSFACESRHKVSNDMPQINLFYLITFGAAASFNLKSRKESYFGLRNWLCVCKWYRIVSSKAFYSIFERGDSVWCSVRVQSSPKSGILPDFRENAPIVVQIDIQCCTLLSSPKSGNLPDFRENAPIVVQIDIQCCTLLSLGILGDENFYLLDILMSVSYSSILFFRLI
jgi:hypothetical protein